MIDKDGFERPDQANEHMLEMKHQTRRVKFDEKYSYRPRNIFFRAWAAFFRGLAICVFNPVMVIKNGMFAFGTENRKKMRGKGFVMTCNHVSMMDDVAIGSNIFCWRKMYYTTLEQNIRRPAVGFFLRSLGGIPIPTQSIAGTKKFNEDVSYLLNKNKPVLYNPEGSLWPKYREVRTFKRGAFVTAVKNDVPVLPIVALFKRRKKRNGKFKYKMYFAICKPVYADKELTERDASEKLRLQVQETTKRIAKEWYEIQDCGFGDEKISRQLQPNKNLFFEDDQWIVTINAHERKRSKDGERTKKLKFQEEFHAQGV